MESVSEDGGEDNHVNPTMHSSYHDIDDMMKDNDSNVMLHTIDKTGGIDMGQGQCDHMSTIESQRMLPSSTGHDVGRLCEGDVEDENDTRSSKPIVDGTQTVVSPTSVRPSDGAFNCSYIYNKKCCIFIDQ